MLKERMQAIEEALTGAVARSQSGRDRLRAIFRWYENWFNQPDFQGCVFIAALYEYQADPQVVSMAEAQRERLRELIRRTLLDIIHPSILDQLSRQLVFLLYGAIIFAQTGRKGAAAQDAWECASQLIDFALQGRM
ncbi:MULTISPECIES: TetR family transcriptional regulator C-terminal domain-containing protein [unclassified Caballeronia]|uniref:TetR family transcriptional regulator C-terminal domain-containing protein n=1 Tax=unclassified Caballeronia TaxID=2646786 RepID=UPI003857A33A